MAIPTHNRSQAVNPLSDIKTEAVLKMYRRAIDAPPPDDSAAAREEVSLRIQDTLIALRGLGEKYIAHDVALWENGDLFVAGTPVHPRDVAHALVAHIGGKLFRYSKNGSIDPSTFEERAHHSGAVFDIYELRQLQLETFEQLRGLAGATEEHQRLGSGKRE